MATEKTVKKVTKKSTASAAPKKQRSVSATAKRETKKTAAVKPSTVKELKKVKSDIFAVVKIAGVQIKVEEGKLYEVNKVNFNKGDSFDVSEVLLVSTADNVTMGKPFVSGAKVTFLVDSQKKDEKINGFKYKAKSRYHKRFGHRQLISRLQVTKISA